ncbi:redoxin domain-containing protein [Poriferisphaera sp. WC338]|uniref:TlpA disulfide reductase family protein n=1 Tax=Poriferisphaera sp. WC338 TaxID=3425129 RepID=UPI003D812FA8
MGTILIRGLLYVMMLLCVAGTELHAAVSVGQNPDYRIRSMRGEVITSEKLRGKIVILDFWATWCPPCVDSMPHMKELYKATHGKGVVIIGISLDRRGRDVSTFVRKNGISWPQMLDSKRTMTEQFGVSGIPRVFIMGPDGKVEWTGHPMRMDQPIKDIYKKYKDQLTTKASKQKKAAEEEAREDEEAAAFEVDAATRKQALGLIAEAQEAAKAGNFAVVLQKLSAIPVEAARDPELVDAAVKLAMSMQSQILKNPEIAMLIKDNPEMIRQLRALQQAARESKSQKKALEKLRGKKIERQNTADPRKKVNPKLLASKMAQAEAAERGQDLVKAYEKYQWVIKRGGDSEEAKKAAARVRELEADETFAERYESHKQDEKGKQMLKTAASYLKADEKEGAIEVYQEILAKYPKAYFARAAAKEALKELGVKAKKD